MLKHDDAPETQSPSAAQFRVTPEELASAIARLEARKDVSQRNLDGTIAIGEAVEQLGLDTTPEEVLAEVQARRQHQERSGKRLSRKQSIGAIGAVVVALTGLYAWQVQVPPMVSDSLPIPSETFVRPVATTTSHIRVDPNLLVGDSSGKVVMLSEVGDTQPVHCNFDGTQFSQYSPENAAALWTLIKHNGKVYVRGRILKMSPKVFSLNGADVTTVDNDPRFSVPVTLPIDGFKITPNTGSNVEFHAQNIHLDRYAYEKWQP